MGEIREKKQLKRETSRKKVQSGIGKRAGGDHTSDLSRLGRIGGYLVGGNKSSPRTNKHATHNKKKTPRENVNLT